jgi:hypothetical protein
VAANPMITIRRAVISVILAGCFALMVFGFTQVRPTNTPPTFKNAAVKGVSPNPGDLVLRQSPVSITLMPGYTLAYDTVEGLAISTDGERVGIPQDELQIVGNQYAFLPAPGRQFSELPVGRVCVVVQIKQAVNPGDPGQPFSWCFQTH